MLQNGIQEREEAKFQLVFQEPIQYRSLNYCQQLTREMVAFLQQKLKYE